MSTNRHAVDPALFNDLKAGSEPAFERLFRQRYVDILAEALPLLDGDAAAAARAVESAFQRLWKGHEAFTTPDEFESHLHAALNEAASRIRNRHAMAGHLGGFEKGHRKGEPHEAPSVDDAWAKVRAAMHANVAEVHTGAAHVEHHPGRELAAAMHQMEPPRPWGQIIAATVVLAGLLGGLGWYMMRSYEEGALETALRATTVRDIATTTAQFGSVELGDGSTVRLGPESRLRLPEFSDVVRGLSLEGTAAFTVAPGHERAFTVLAGDTRLDATATEFAVRAYPEESRLIVHVRSGSVTAMHGDSARTVSAGEALAIGRDGTPSVPAATEVAEAVGWVDSTIVRSNVPLREMLPVLKRWFGLEFAVQEERLLDRMVSLKAGIGAINDARLAIEQSGNLERVWVDSAQVLRERRR